MKILYDSQIFRMQTFGGISRYFNKLCRYNGGRFEYKISGRYSENIYVRQLSSIKPFPIQRHFKGKDFFVNMYNNLSDKLSIEGRDYDVYHPTYYFVPKYPKSTPVVITAHDFIHEIFPQFSSQEDMTICAKKQALTRANKIIAISEATKKDLLKLYPDTPEEKIDVVLHAIEWNFRPKGVPKNYIPKPYILFTGARTAYKNFLPFVEACAPILTGNDLYLVCTGSPLDRREADFFEKLGITGRVIQVFADENELRSLYENALCFVFPSLYEGFGLPILESFVSGCPAVLSDTSCFPEIAGDAAMYFDPYSINGMRERIAEVVLSGALRQELAGMGTERFKLFTMDRMMEGTARTYQAAINDSRI